MNCYDVHKRCNVECDKKECRLWIDYENDLNCTVVAVANNNHGSMTLREIADRMGVSFVRIKQIENKILEKLKKRNINLQNFLKQ